MSRVSDMLAALTNENRPAKFPFPPEVAGNLYLWAYISCASSN